MGGHPVFTQHDGLYLRAVGHHGEYQITVLSDLRVVGRFSAAGNKFFYIGGAQVTDSQIIAGLEKIFCHRLSHNT